MRNLSFFFLTSSTVDVNLFLKGFYKKKSDTALKFISQEGRLKFQFGTIKCELTQGNVNVGTNKSLHICPIFLDMYLFLLIFISLFSESLCDNIEKELIEWNEPDLSDVY